VPTIAWWDPWHATSAAVADRPRTMAWRQRSVSSAAVGLGASGGKMPSYPARRSQSAPIGTASSRVARRISTLGATSRPANGAESTLGED